MCFAFRRPAAVGCPQEHYSDCIYNPLGRPFRSTMKKVSDDEMVFDMFDTHDGVEHKVMTVTSTRRK